MALGASATKTQGQSGSKAEASGNVCDSTGIQVTGGLLSTIELVLTLLLIEVCGLTGLDVLGDSLLTLDLKFMSTPELDSMPVPFERGRCGCGYVVAPL